MKTSLLSAMALISFSLTGCSPQDDGESWSRTEQPAAGQAIRLDHMISHLPGQAYRLTYRSTDARNSRQLIRVSAEVLVPRGTPPATGWPVLSWGHAESGQHLTCAPSVMGLGTVQERFYAPWLNRGYAIVATDYPGLGEPGNTLLLNARSEAMSMLDALRAAHARLPDISQTTILSGHAQGAQAALAAASLAPTYTPHIKVLGTIAIAPPYLDATGVQDLLHPHNSRSFSPVVPELLSLGASLSASDPSVHVDQIFTPRAQTLLPHAATECSTDFFARAQHSGLTPASLLRPDANPILTSALTSADYPSLTLSAPVMIATGTQDQHSLPTEQNRLASALCTAGTHVTHQTYSGASHNGVLMSSASDALSFAQRLSAGQSPQDTCPTRSIHR